MKIIFFQYVSTKNDADGRFIVWNLVWPIKYGIIIIATQFVYAKSNTITNSYTGLDHFFSKFNAE